MDQHFTNGDKNNLFNAYAYTTGELLVEVLRRRGNDLSRENVLKQATNLKDVRLELLPQGILINTTP